MLQLWRFYLLSRYKVRLDHAQDRIAQLELLIDDPSLVDSDKNARGQDSVSSILSDHVVHEFS